MTERELIDRTAADAALEEEEEDVDATADEREEARGLATAETESVAGRAAATLRACAMPRDAMVVLEASGGGKRGGRCVRGGAAGGGELRGEMEEQIAFLVLKF
jgi:hypothetical protein